jgi:hypothetical protein
MGFMSVDDTMDDVVREPGDFLELGDREFGPIACPDGVQEVGLILRELRLLPADRPVQEAVEPDRLIKVLLGLLSGTGSGTTSPAPTGENG